MAKTETLIDAIVNKYTHHHNNNNAKNSNGNNNNKRKHSTNTNTNNSNNKNDYIFGQRVRSKGTLRQERLKLSALWILLEFIQELGFRVWGLGLKV